LIKVLSIEQIRWAEKATLSAENITELELMERAAAACTQWIITNIPLGISFAVFCGKGNNGGDGLAIARQLWAKGKNVDVYILNDSGTGSLCFNKNLENWKSLSGTKTNLISEVKEMPKFENPTVIIDAIFGIGLSRKIESPISDFIHQINNYSCRVIAIDMPSGLFSEEHTTELKNVVAAQHTLTFSNAKQAFFYPEYAHLTGEIEILDIGLDPEIVSQAHASAFIPDDQNINVMLGQRPGFGHKGIFGHALLLAGSYGKSGAALLAAKSCLRSGVGLVTMSTPKCAVLPLQTACPEAMCLAHEHEYYLSDIIKPEGYNAIGIGPGIGQDPQTGNVLKRLIQDYKSPMVIDADAINLLAYNPTWLNFLPAGCILTPHLGEFNRLAGKIADPFERTKKQLELAKKYNCYILLKGKYSALACPDGQLFFNPTGNNGMAKAGSGDVLTGLITGLLAQGLASKHAALAGAYLHGLAGDICARETNPRSMKSGDLVEYFSGAFRAVGR